MRRDYSAVQQEIAEEHKRLRRLLSDIDYQEAAGKEATEFQVQRLDASNHRIERLAAELEEIDAPRQQLEANMRADPNAGRRLGTPVTDYVRDSVEDDPGHGFTTGAGEFLSAAWDAAIPGNVADRRLFIGSAASGMSQGVAADGGFAVPPKYANEIWDHADDVEDLLAMTTQFTVTGASLTIAANAETDRATGSRYGGVRGYWISEAGQITSSNPTLRQIKLEPEELAVLVYATDKLLKNNTMALEQHITRAASEELRFLTSDAIVNGTGAGQPLGVMNAACLVTASKETGQPATTFLAENVLSMWARLLPRARKNAAWFINVDVEPQLHKMYFPTGAAGALVYSPPGGLSGSPYATLMGRPVIPIQSAQTLGTTGDVILGDLRWVAAGVRGGIEAASSIHLRFDYLESCFRFVLSVDAQPFLASAITPFKGSDTLSPFVVLETRS